VLFRSNFRMVDADSEWPFTNMALSHIPKNGIHVMDPDLRITPCYSHPNINIRFLAPDFAVEK